MRLALILALIAAPALADGPMTGAEFEDFVEGKTLTFSSGLVPYGIEYYAPNRRVIWSPVGGDCVMGEWYEDRIETGPSICFIYENRTEAQCWQVFDVDGQIRADYMNEPGTTVLYEAKVSEPLVCGGVGT